MNRFLLCVLSLGWLAGCAGSASNLGLTGAPQAATPVEPSDADIGTPGIHQQGAAQYGSSGAPRTGPGRYFGYDQ